MSLIDVLDGLEGFTSKKAPSFDSDQGFLEPYIGPSGGSGGSSEPARNSRERGAPERFDLNTFVPQGFGKKQDAPVALQALEVAGRAPGFVAERPIALLDTVLGDEQGKSVLDDLGNFGPLKFLGEVVNNVSSIPAAIANSSTADALVRGTKEGWSDDQLLQTGLGKQMTWGEYKAEAAQKGWTAQDIDDLMAGRKSATDFGDRAMSTDGLTELGLRVASDPFNLIFGVGAAAKLASGTGLLARAARAGAIAEKPLAPALAAAASAQGIAQSSTWFGLARYFGQAGRGIGMVPGGAAALGAAGKGLSATATGLGAYKKAAIATSAAQVGVGVVDRATEGIRGGFLEGLFELNQEVWDNQPLSQNSAFMLFSAFHFDPVRGLGQVVKAGQGVKNRLLPPQIRASVLDALAEGESWAGKATHQQVLDRLGGPEALDNLIVHTHAQMVFERLQKNPIIRASLSHFDSLDEAILANRKLGEQITNILRDEYQGNRFSAKDTVAQLRGWHANRSGQKQSGIEFQWDGGLAADRWVEYSGAVAPVSKIFQERGDIVMGLVENVLAEDLRNMGSALRVAGGRAKQVPIADVRRWLSRYPQLTDDPWWAKFNSTEFDGRTVPYGPMQGKLTRLAKDAPTTRDVTREMAVAEQVAAKDEFLAQDPTSDFSEPASTISVSRMRPRIAKRLGMAQDRVDSIQASRGDADIATFEGNLGRALESAGLPVERVEQSIGAWEGSLEPSVQIRMDRATLPELRMTAAMVGRAGDQDAVALAITRERIRELGLTPNGFEIKIALPSTSRAQLQAVHEALAREFPGYTINDTTGLVSILAPGGQRAELVEALPRLGEAIEGLYPRDLIGDSGVRTSVHPAYIEFITKKKGEGDGSYAEVLREARSLGDARAEAVNSVSSALAVRRAARGDAPTGVGSDEAVGRVAGDGRPGGRNLAQPPAESVGLGLALDITPEQVSPEFVYHITDPNRIGAIATEGLKAQYPGGLTHPDGGTGRRLYVSDDPYAAVTQRGRPDAGEAVLRIRRTDAGRVRRGYVDRESYTAKSIKPSLVEVYGADGRWYPIEEWFAPALEPDIVEGAQTVMPAYREVAAQYMDQVDELAFSLDEGASPREVRRQQQDLARSHGISIGTRFAPWGSAHSASRAMAGDAAERMGIKGYESGDLSPAAQQAVTKYLEGIAASPGSDMALFSGQRAAGGRPVPSIGDTLELPLTATSPSRSMAEGFARPLRRDESGRGYVYEFGPGTRATYHSSDEFLTAGRYAVESVEEVAHDAFYGTTGHPDAEPITVVRLRQIEVFDPGPARFDPVPDPLTAGLRAHEDTPWQASGAPGDEAALAAELASLTPERLLDDESFAQAQATQSRLEATRLAKGEARRGEVLYMARRDAEASTQIPFHRSLSGMDDVAKAELAEFEQRLRDHYPPYTLQKAPKAAIVMADRGEIAAQYLRDRTLLGDALAKWGPLGSIARTLDWLKAPVSNTKLARQARQALMNELLPRGAKPSDVDRFLAALDQQASLATFGPFQVRAFRNGASLGAQAINKIAAGDPEVGLPAIFSDKVVAAVGRDNFARLLDRSSNRFVQQMERTAKAGGKKGGLARALNGVYDGFSETAFGDASRVVSKTFYHWFRFLSDLRWHAMNMFEADMIGGLKYGIGSTRFSGAHKAEPGLPARLHQLGKEADSGDFERALGDGNGWLYTRRHGGYISRAFDQQRPETVQKILRGMADEDPVIRDLKEIVRQQDVVDGRTARTAGEIADEDMVGAIDRLLYTLDEKGAKATFVDEAKELLGAEETQRLLPFLQKVWEANDAAYQSIVQMFHGNPARSNLERIANSWWLYWPISYQVKATKWLVSVMADSAFGQKTNLAPAALYAHHLEQHRNRLANNPEYVSMFENHPTAWFLAQMMFPITPGDIGVSLSRPIRYGVGAAGDALEDATGSRMGLWGSYKSAEDPITAAGAILSMGPVYTAELLARVGREMFEEPTENLAP